MRRLLALLGAVLMVTVAFLVRAVLDDGDGPGAVGGDPPDLLCARELEEVCGLLADEGIAEVTVEDVGVTVERLGSADADLDADAWLTIDPLPGQVDERRGFDTGDALFADPLATDRSTGLALVAFDTRAAALDTDCREVDWSCLGDAAGEPWAEHGGQVSWGPVRPGYDAPDTSATGLLVLAQAMAAHLDDPGFAGQDIDVRWLGDLEDAVPNRTGDDVLLQLVQQGQGAFAAVGALGVEAEALASSARGSDLAIFYPAPMFRASVVLAPVRGADVDALEDLVADDLDALLADAGWEEGTAGAPLPSPGVLDALRSAWEEGS